jgi:phage terminase large subunit-like protein
VQQVAGMFDVHLAEEQVERFTAEIPALDEPWEIGLVVGPSGSGKSTIARAQWPAEYTVARSWPHDRAAIDGFSTGTIKDVTGMLTAVGFSSPPHWIKPYHVLSRMSITSGHPAMIMALKNDPHWRCTAVKRTGYARQPKATRRKSFTGGAIRTSSSGRVVCSFEFAQVHVA